MRYKKAIICFLVLAGLGAGRFISAQTDAKSYYYDLIKVDIQINPDSSFDVVEEQTYNLTGSFGYLFRDLELQKLDHISNIKIFDEAGGQIDQAEISYQGNVIHLQWNFPRKDFQGENKKWQIKYKVHGGLGFYENYDELYWNAIFAAREVNVARAEIIVHLPAETEVDNLQIRSFLGKAGEKTESGYQIVDKKTVSFSAADIEPNQYLTIALAWPKGLVAKPFLYRNQLYNWLILVLALLLPVFFFKKCYSRWKKLGRDPKINKTIIAQYEPPARIATRNVAGWPKYLAPAFLGALMTQDFSIKDVTATIIDLAVRGYVKIKEGKKGFLGGQEYVFEKTKEANDLKQFEQKIMAGVFDKGKISVSSSDLKNKFYRKLPDIKKSIYEELAETDYISGDIGKIRLKYSWPYIVLLIFAFVFFFAGAVIASNWLGFLGVWLIIISIALIISGAIGLIFAYLMPALTEQGTEVKWQGLGFKEYLHTAERFRIGAETVETFSKFLPYAVIFGVEKQWANRFADLKYEQPNWYVPMVGYSGQPGAGSSIASFSGLTSSITSFSSSISQTFGSAPGGSGVGGGGGAGGGGGGGGGGAG